MKYAAATHSDTQPEPQKDQMDPAVSAKIQELEKTEEKLIKHKIEEI